MSPVNSLMAETMASKEAEQWNLAASEYKSLTRDVAIQCINAVLSFADSLLPFAQATDLLDNGCGPGPIMERLIDNYSLPPTCNLIASDFNRKMLDQVQQTKDKNCIADPESPWSRVQVVRQDATHLDHFTDNSLTHITAGWVYFLTPDPTKCLTESFRTLKPNGVLSLSSWHSNQWIDVCGCLPKLHPSATLPTMPDGWDSVTGLRSHMESAGFRDVVCETVDVVLKFDTVKGLVDLLMKMPFVSPYVNGLSESEVQELKSAMADATRSMCSSEPGHLNGITIVAAGRK